MKRTGSYRPDLEKHCALCPETHRAPCGQRKWVSEGQGRQQAVKYGGTLIAKPLRQAFQVADLIRRTACPVTAGSRHTTVGL